MGYSRYHQSLNLSSFKISCTKHYLKACVFQSMSALPWISEGARPVKSINPPCRKRLPFSPYLRSCDQQSLLDKRSLSARERCSPEQPGGVHRFPGPPCLERADGPGEPVSASRLVEKICGLGEEARKFYRPVGAEFSSFHCVPERSDILIYLV